MKSVSRTKILPFSQTEEMEQLEKAQIVEAARMLDQKPTMFESDPILREIVEECGADTPATRD